MKASKTSHTADFAAAVRATYQYRPEKMLYDDPFAVDLTSPLFRVIVKTPLLRKMIMESYFFKRLGASLTILSRARYAEEKFLKAYDKGIRQFIILGAGLDSSALKFTALPEKITFVELDHPNTQAVKLKRMAKYGLKSPHDTHFIPIDFTCDNITDVLRASPIDLDKPAYISWMGVTYYLTQSDTLTTLKSLGDILAEGSQLSFDYMDERLFDSNFLKTVPILKKDIEEFFKFTEDKGEPLLSGFSPHSLKEFLRATDWHLTETIHGAENAHKYLTTAPDFLWPTEFDHLAHIDLKKGLHND